MVKSLYSGVSGLKTHQSKMDVIGNNIANVNTTGFKSGVVTFKDVYYQNKINPSSGTSTLGGVNPAQVGYGVRLNSTVANMTQSGFTYTDSKWDMALDGEGFTKPLFMMEPVDALAWIEAMPSVEAVLVGRDGQVMTTSRVPI